VHARVRIDGNGIAIYDGRTLKRLTISRAECVAKIEQAIALTVDLDSNMGDLLRNVESQKKISNMLDEIFKTVEDQGK
jgi:hypothetical protein